MDDRIMRCGIIRPSYCQSVATSEKSLKRDSCKKASNLDPDLDVDLSQRQ